MVLNVDLQRSKCYKKVKKLLCKFPEIRDQTYDEKANKVTITVVSCSPEKIRDKLCCKGGGCITNIKIIIKIENPPPPPTVKVSIDQQVNVSIEQVNVSIVQAQGIFDCICCRGRPWGHCSCGGQVCDSWCGYGSGCEETQPGCTTM